MGFENVVKCLCEHVDVRKTNLVRAKEGRGLTALHLAALSKHYEVASILIKHGVPINLLQGTFAWSALHCAAESGNAATVRLLLNQGADLWSEDIVGWTPLHLAAMGGHSAVVRLLLQNG
ncbi:ankyrin, partial [Cryphonectria parasitica EP155]